MMVNIVLNVPDDIYGCSDIPRASPILIIKVSILCSDADCHGDVFWVIMRHANDPGGPGAQDYPFIIGHGGDGAPDNTDNGDEDVDVMIVLYSIV